LNLVGQAIAFRGLSRFAGHDRRQKPIVGPTAYQEILSPPLRGMRKISASARSNSIGVGLPP
jgi:hypothetical protein